MSLVGLSKLVHVAMWSAQHNIDEIESANFLFQKLVDYDYPNSFPILNNQIFTTSRPQMPEDLLLEKATCE